MEMKKLLEFIKKEDERLKEKHNNYEKEEKRTLGRAIKLTDELGELCESIVSENSSEEVSDKFSNVIITTLLLAKSKDIDIEKSLEKKMEEIDKTDE